MYFLKYVTSFYGVDNIQERIDRLLEVFDLDPGRKIAELSMGNKKKVSIGQAESDRERKLVFMFSGNINDLIGKLASQQIENLSIEEPSLEEIFLHYYK